MKKRSQLTKAVFIRGGTLVILVAVVFLLGIGTLSSGQK